MIETFLSRDIDIANLPVCPSSVRPSVRYVPVPDENGLTYRHSFFPPYGSPIILVLPASTFSQNSDGVTPCGGAKYSRYISQTIQDIAIVMKANKNSYAIYQN